MARGAEAKKTVTQKILETFDGSFEYDRKIYLYAMENGERVQLALSLTCPKNEVQSTGTVLAPTATSAWGDGAVTTTVVNAAPAAERVEITDEERDNIATMMARLGL